MALTSSNVRVAVTGAVYVGPTTADAPTTPTSALDVDFVDLGYISEDGVTEERERDTEDIKGHNGVIVRTVVTEASATFTMTLIETKKEVIELFYGSAVTSTVGYGHISVDPAETGGRKSFVIDTVDGSENIRTYIPEGEVVEVGEVARKVDEPLAYEITIKAYPATSLSGDAFKTFYSAFGS